MVKKQQLIRIIMQLTGLWLFIALWWGLTTLAPMQIHNRIVKHDLPFICIGIFIFLLFGFWQRPKISFCALNKAWIIPLILLIIIDLGVIFYVQYITLSFFF